MFTFNSKKHTSGTQIYIELTLVQVNIYINRLVWSCFCGENPLLPPGRISEAVKLRIHKIVLYFSLRGSKRSLCPTGVHLILLYFDRMLLSTSKMCVFILMVGGGWLVGGDDF